MEDSPHYERLFWDNPQALRRTVFSDDQSPPAGSRRRIFSDDHSPPAGSRRRIFVDDEIAPASSGRRVLDEDETRPAAPIRNLLGDDQLRPLTSRRNEPVDRPEISRTLYGAEEVFVMPASRRDKDWRKTRYYHRERSLTRDEQAVPPIPSMFTEQAVPPRPSLFTEQSASSGRSSHTMYRPVSPLRSSRALYETENHPRSSKTLYETENRLRSSNSLYETGNPPMTSHTLYETREPGRSSNSRTYSTPRCGESEQTRAYGRPREGYVTSNRVVAEVADRPTIIYDGKSRNESDPRYSSPHLPRRSSLERIRTIPESSSEVLFSNLERRASDLWSRMGQLRADEGPGFDRRADDLYHDTRTLQDMIWEHREQGKLPGASAAEIEDLMRSVSVLTSGLSGLRGENDP